MTFYSYLCSVNSPRRKDVLLRNNITSDASIVFDYTYQCNEELVRVDGEPVAFGSRQWHHWNLYPRLATVRTWMVTLSMPRQSLMTYALGAVFTIWIGGMAFRGCRLATMEHFLGSHKVSLTFQCLACTPAGEVSHHAVRIVSDSPIAVYATDDLHVAFAHVVEP